MESIGKSVKETKTEDISTVVEENLRYLMEDIYESKAEGEGAEELNRLKRMFGCIIGAFVGDAAGAVLEFKGDPVNEEDV